MNKLTSILFKILGVLLIASGFVKVLHGVGIQILPEETITNIFEHLYNHFFANLLFSFLFFGLPGILVTRFGAIQIRNRERFSGIIMLLAGLLMITMFGITTLTNLHAHHLI